MVVVFIPQIAECAGDNPLSEEGGSSSNPLSRFKPSKASLDVLEHALKKKRDKKLKFPLEENKKVLRGYLNTITLCLNDVLQDNGYAKVRFDTVEKALFELQKDPDLLSFYFAMNENLEKKKDSRGCLSARSLLAGA